jgi:DNA replication and repair protein RecF
LRLVSVKIENFRNHKNLEFEPGPKITNIYGKNGSGKTSILECIQYSALTKGFIGTSDNECLMFNEEMFSITSLFIKNNDHQIKVKVTYGREKEKKIFFNEQEIKTFSTHIGVIPCVTFTPKDMIFVQGSPSERRRFIDSTISQSDRKYLKNLIINKRILHQRNTVLDTYNEYKDDKTLEILTEQFIKTSAEIIEERIRFSKQFSDMMKVIYTWFPEGKKPEIKYELINNKFDQNGKKEEIEEIYKEKYKILRNNEIRRGLTLFGPQRDDLKMTLDNKDIKKYSSQGQQRAFIVAMKITMMRYLKKMKEEYPICLFDDMFSELDKGIKEKILESISTDGQIILTNTERIDNYGIMNISTEK